MNPLWTSKEALMATQGKSRGEWQAFDVAIDSRDVRPGDLFVAIRGDNTDGHKYVEAALKAGAVAAVVEHDDMDYYGNLPLLIVPDTLKALQNLGVAARARSAATRIGVTGSVGKTGTKEALKAAFERQGRTHASIRSFNNHIGVPLTLARLPGRAEFAVFEMGMNHPGELTQLSAQVRPDIAIITTIQPAHTAFFSSVEEIADAKAEIFDGMAPEGVAILNRDNDQFARLDAAARDRGLSNILSFGEAEDADVRLIRAKQSADCSCVTADICGQLMMYKVGLAGKHWIDNSLAVLAAVYAAGGDLSQAGLALAALAPLGGRGQRHRLAWPGGAITVIDESYNASPAAMKAAIGVLGNAELTGRGRRIAVIGDMLELGDDSARYHRELVDPLKDAGVDSVFTIGAHTKHLAEALGPNLHAGHAADVEEMVTRLQRKLLPDDVVLVKASNSMGLAKVIEGLKKTVAPKPTTEAQVTHAL